MISIVVYGRNDSHGYNLHKRTALSLNSLAYALTDPEDEIIFVDWNSPESLPPFPVAISDTLSKNVWEKLRIIRVPQSVHVQCSGQFSQRSTIEPIARNVAIRRMNPANTWVLSTNTDVVLTCGGSSLTGAVSAITAPYVGAPRFELPEWIWEGLPRNDAKAVQSQLSLLADKTPLRQIVKSYEHIGFDAPGDFQLVRRSLMEEIGCFDETMLRGWHVDSNLGRRLYEVVGPPEPISAEVEVFHCNHTREQTHFHQSAIQPNDLNEYVWGDVPVIARSGKSNWGLPDVSLEESTLGIYEKARNSLIASWRSFDTRIGVQDFSSECDRLSGIPFDASVAAIMDVLSTTQTSIGVAYLGTRSEVEMALHDLERELPWVTFVVGPEVGSACCPNTWVIIDVTPPEACLSREVSDVAALTQSDRAAVVEVLKETGRLIERLQAGKDEPPNFLILNAEANDFENCLAGAFDMLPVQFNSRVRRARIKPQILSAQPSRLIMLYARVLIAARRAVCSIFEPVIDASSSALVGGQIDSPNDRLVTPGKSPIRAFLVRGFAILSKPLRRSGLQPGAYSRTGICIPIELTRRF